MNFYLQKKLVLQEHQNVIQLLRVLFLAPFVKTLVIQIFVFIYNTKSMNTGSFIIYINKSIYFLEVS